MLVGFHKKAGIPLGAGSHHKEFSDPLFIKAPKYRIKNIVMKKSSLLLESIL